MVRRRRKIRENQTKKKKQCRRIVVVHTIRDGLHEAFVYDRVVLGLHVHGTMFLRGEFQESRILEPGLSVRSERKDSDLAKEDK